MSRNVELKRKRNGKSKNNKQRHSDETDQNVLECRYNNLTFCSIFIYCPYKAEGRCVPAKANMILLEHKLRVTYAICFKCQLISLR